MYLPVLETTGEYRVQYYVPPYLLSGGAQPVITAAPSQVAYGAVFTVSFTLAASATFSRCLTQSLHWPLPFHELAASSCASHRNVTSPAERCEARSQATVDQCLRSPYACKCLASINNGLLLKLVDVKAWRYNAQPGAVYGRKLGSVPGSMYCKTSGTS